MEGPKGLATRLFQRSAHNARHVELARLIAFGAFDCLSATRVQVFLSNLGAWPQTLAKVISEAPFFDRNPQRQEASESQFGRLAADVGKRELKSPLSINVDGLPQMRAKVSSIATFSNRKPRRQEASELNLGA